MESYKKIPLTLPVEDEPVRRLCEVMTRAGYKTTDSCEGHGKRLPQIFFCCPSQYYLRHFSSVLSRESYEANLPWRIATFTGDVFLNPDSMLHYLLEPREKQIDAARNYRKLIDDLDI